MARKLIFVDTETTGLDFEQDQLVELSYATLHTPVKTLYFGVTEVPSFIDNLIGFTKRGIAGRKSTQGEIDEFLRLSEGQTMVAANPTFDHNFMQKNDLFRFHYRMLDIEAMAFASGDYDEVPGLFAIQQDLKGRGYKIPEPDHTSAKDVEALVATYKALM